LAKKAIHALGPDRVLLAPSCSLLHVPVRLASETELDPELVRWLAFADEKLAELSLLAAAAAGNREADAALLANEEDIFSRRRSERVCVAAVRARLAALR